MNSLVLWGTAHHVSNLFVTCRLVLTLSRRKANKLRGVGAIVQQREHSTCIAAAKDELWHVAFDLHCLYCALERELVAVGPPGAQAIGATCAVLALTSNDMGPGLAGVAVEKMFKAFFSPEFAAAMHGHHLLAVESWGDADSVALQPTATMGVELPRYTLSVHGAVALVYCTLQASDKINKQLALR